MSYWESDNFCLAQLGAWRMCLKNVLCGVITRVKDDFVKNLRQEENFDDHTDAAVASRFIFFDK
jgi:hypothetical protein